MGHFLIFQIPKLTLFVEFTSRQVWSSVLFGVRQETAGNDIIPYQI